VNAVPDSKHDHFTGLPEAARDRVQWLCRLLQPLLEVNGGHHKLCVHLAAGTDMSGSTLYGIWRKYVASGYNLQALVDKRRTSEDWQRKTNATIGLPDAFVTFWKTEVEKNQRAARPVHRLLCLRYKRWAAGDYSQAVPGYPHCPPPYRRTGLPHGWTYSNLIRVQPSKIELQASRQGRSAALELIAGVATTRVGSRPFSEIQFDDMWHDFLVTVARQGQPCRLLEFGCMDRHSGFIFPPGLKPRLKNQASGKQEQLNGRDFTLFVINFLIDYGWHPEGTKFNVENGTAAISRELEDKLLFWSRGLVTIMRSGMSGSPAYKGGYSERAKGNYKVKAVKEGAGKMIHNQLAHLPGQVGMNRDNLPAENDGRVKETRGLLALTAALPELAAKLQMGHLPLAEAVQAVNGANAILNNRTDHQIEGWEELGYMVEEFCASPEMGGWTNLNDALAQLPEGRRELVKVQLELNPDLVRRRKLSPREVLEPCLTGLIRLPDAAIPDLLGKAYGEVKTVARGTVQFTRPEFSSPLRYRATYLDLDGYRRRIDEGDKVLCHLNPWKPEWLYLSCAATGRFLGKAERDTAIQREDLDALHHRMGKVQGEYKDAIRDSAHRQGLDRLPGISLNTRILREHNAPTARDRALSAAEFQGEDLLSEADLPDVAAGDYAPEEAHMAFDPADMLD
jgi:hypothetical protein